MKREIVKFGAKVLRRAAAPVAAVNSEVAGLVQDLFDSLAEAEGVGLAAPQIGVSRRVIVVDVSAVEGDKPPLALINPAIVGASGEAVAEEGCLSIPELYGDVARYTEVEIDSIDVNGESYRFEAEGFYAPRAATRDRPPRRQAVHRLPAGAQAQPHARGPEENQEGGRGAGPVACGRRLREIDSRRTLP